MSIENVIGLVVLGGAVVAVGLYVYRKHQDSKKIVVRAPVVLPPTQAPKKAVATKKAAPVAKYSEKNIAYQKAAKKAMVVDKKARK